jgi:sirohydrochlorin cobaltochelatase
VASLDDHSAVPSRGLHAEDLAPQDQVPNNREELQALDAKVNALLPPQYQNCYDTVPPVSMGSAGLVFGSDGKVAWDQIWTSFCDLALAGGPPHRGTLLEAVAAEEALAAPEAYQATVEEIARGIWMVTGLPVLPHFAPGWVGVRCRNERMASWLVRAIVVENISARQKQDYLYLPAGPQFRLAKEIKNIVTAMAKTCHYWTDHMPASPWTDVAGTIEGRAVSEELFEPALPAEVRASPDAYQLVVQDMERGIRHETGLSTVPSPCLGWVGIQCSGVDMAVWLMRAMIVDNVLVRREQDIIYLPAASTFLEENRIRKVVDIFARAFRLWQWQKN